MAESYPVVETAPGATRQVLATAPELTIVSFLFEAGAEGAERSSHWARCPASGAEESSSVATCRAGPKRAVLARWMSLAVRAGSPPMA